MVSSLKQFNARPENVNFVDDVFLPAGISDRVDEIVTSHSEKSRKIMLLACVGIISPIDWS